MHGTSSDVLTAFPTWLKFVRIVTESVWFGVAEVLGSRVCGGAGLFVGPDVHDAVDSRVVSTNFSMPQCV